MEPIVLPLTGFGATLDLAVADAHDRAVTWCSLRLHECGSSAFRFTLVLKSVEVAGSGETHSYDNNRAPSISALFDLRVEFQ